MAPEGLRDAELLSDAVDAALSGRQAWPDALAAYERSRNATTLADYRENLVAARLEPPPSVMQLRRQLRYDPVATREFFLAREGIAERELHAPNLV